MENLLWNRQWTVEVNGIQVTELRVSFKITRTLKPEPNSMEITIYNLSDRTRALMQGSRVPVVLVAGYKSNFGVIFRGEARTIDHGSERPNLKTLIRCVDGGGAFQFARVKASFGRGVSADQVVRAAAEALGVDRGNLDQRLAAGGFTGVQQFLGGYTAHGRASKELDRALKAIGLEWSIQNGALQVLGRAETLPGQAVLLDSGSGMEGSPEHGSANDPKKPSVLKVKARLNPLLQPGVRVEVRTKSFQGQFKVQKVEHAGDSHGKDWNSDLEVLPV